MAITDDEEVLIDTTFVDDKDEPEQYGVNIVFLIGFTVLVRKSPLRAIDKVDARNSYRVYIGNFNTRIREKLWDRITSTVGDGEATMSYACRNEIGYQFVTWNTERESIDYEGIPLVLIPACADTPHKQTIGFSNASKFRNVREFSGVKPAVEESLTTYVVIDIETDGLDESKHTIIELGADRVNGEERTEFNRLIYYNCLRCRN